MNQRVQLPLFLFMTVTIAVFGASLFIVERILAEAPHPGVIATALTIDLTVLVPALYGWLLVRRHGWPAVTLAPVFLLCMMAASYILPNERQQALRVMQWVAVPVELGLIGYVSMRAVSLVRHTKRPIEDGLTWWREVTGLVMPSRRLANVVAFEMALLYYALASWRRSLPAKPGVFSYHRKNAYVAVVAGILVGMLIEMGAVHMLVQQWSVEAAWIATILGGYGLLWGVAEVQAARHRPIEVATDSLTVRSGLRWTIHIPFEAVKNVWDLRGAEAPASVDGHLDTVTLGKPQFLIDFQRPLTAWGLYGFRRTISSISFSVDEPALLSETLRESFEAWKRAI